MIKLFALSFCTESERTDITACLISYLQLARVCVRDSGRGRGEREREREDSRRTNTHARTCPPPSPDKAEKSGSRTRPPSHTSGEREENFFRKFQGLSESVPGTRGQVRPWRLKRRRDLSSNIHVSWLYNFNPASERRTYFYAQKFV